MPAVVPRLLSRCPPATASKLLCSSLRGSTTIPRRSINNTAFVLRKVGGAPINAKRRLNPMQAPSTAKIAVLGPPDFPPLEELKNLPAEAQVVWTGLDADSIDETDEAIKQVDVLLCCPMAKKDLIAKTMSKLKGLRWVHGLFAGVDHILFPELIASPIPLTNAKGIFSSSLAEYCVAAMLFFAKDIGRLERQKQGMVWDRFPMRELKGATLGILGYGDIGRACARLAKGLGMNVIALKRNPNTAGNDNLVDAVYGQGQVKEVMAAADYVVLAAPLTPETQGMVGAAELAAAGPDTVVINLGRGPLIDEMALVEALETGKIKGAALDVFCMEPLPAEHPLWKAPRILISPHNADFTETFLHESVAFFVSNVNRYIGGLALHNLVDKKIGY